MATTIADSPSGCVTASGIDGNARLVTCVSADAMVSIVVVAAGGIEVKAWGLIGSIEPVPGRARL
ncbi:MAG: hypothetical protein IT384_13425 [Deltaproteobacteria bacterium]|nr:hypothetical protein [Deltaproteobacteria bacterium]